MPEPAQLQHIEELYYDALDLPAAEREAFLANACAGDAALQREVASLLAARAEAAGFLSRPVLELSLLGGDQRPNLAARLGNTIGHYQLLSVLGVGGMGEVFLAEDTRLHRQVALKLLPAEFSQSPQRIHRFEQEARATTALNHPNIVTLHDTGQFEDAYYIVTEFVDGQTLREHLNERGALPVSEALNLAQQIATALAAAHAAHIVHRDIKPENVMLRRDGFVKVLDFGLAKLTDAPLEVPTAQDETHDEETPHSAFRTPHSQTAAGALLGTIRYMSPEQARGETVDARTDVFSLGVVLYEMLMGKHPFARATATQTMAAILEAEPAALPKAIPAALQSLVTDALCKNRDRRLSTAGAFAAELQRVNKELQFSVRLADEPWWRGWWRRWPVGVSGLLLIATTIYLWQMSRERFESTILTQLKFTPVDSWKTEPEQSMGVLSVSPDGKRLVFSKVQNGQPDIYLKSFNGDPARKLTNDVWNDSGPIWSPDGKAVAYVSLREGQNEVWVTPYPTGEARRLGVLPTRPKWLTRWSANGAHIYYEADGNLHDLTVATGASQPITQFVNAYHDKEFALSFDNQWIAYKEKVANVVQIFIAPLAGGTPQQLTHESEDPATPVWLPDGERLLYCSMHNGIRQIFLAFRDGRKPVQLTNGQTPVRPWEATHDGRRVFYFVQPDQESDLYWHDLRTGAEKHLTTALPEEAFPAFAPDERSVVFQQANPPNNFYQQTLFSQALAGDDPIRLNESGSDARWSPRGDRIAFLRQAGGDYQLWVMRPDGTDARLIVKQISFLGYSEKPYGWLAPPNFSWSPDGQRLAYAAVRAGQSNLFTITADGSNETQLTDHQDAALKLFSPSWSPDGSRLIYQVRRKLSASVQYEIYLRDQSSARLLWQSDEPVRLLGWSTTQSEFYIATVKGARAFDPAFVKLLRLSVAPPSLRQTVTEVAQFDRAYWQTFTLAPTARQLAFVARQDNTANVWIASLATGERRRLTANDDPSLSMGCLNWSPQAHLLGFTKQSNTTSIWMIENFK